jgi:hypothetical protein
VSIAGVNSIDSTAVHALSEIIDAYRAKAMCFLWTNVKSEVRYGDSVILPQPSLPQVEPLFISITMRFIAHPQWTVARRSLARRDTMDQSGLTSKIGPENFFNR